MEKIISKELREFLEDYVKTNIGLSKLEQYYRLYEPMENYLKKEDIKNLLQLLDNVAELKEYCIYWKNYYMGIKGDTAFKLLDVYKTILYCLEGKE